MSINAYRFLSPNWYYGQVNHEKPLAGLRVALFLAFMSDVLLAVRHVFENSNFSFK